MDCPKCGTEMKECWGRVPVVHYYSKDVKPKTKGGRYWECSKDHKQFIATIQLVEIEGALPSFKENRGRPIDPNLKVVGR